jgi:hypothetical protein
MDSILRPCFLAAVERKPRIECSANLWLSRSRPALRPWLVRSVPGSLPPCSRRAERWLPWQGRALRSFCRPWLLSSGRPWLCPWRLSGLGRALRRAGTLLRGGLLRRDVHALFRNSGGVFGNCGFYIRHSGESFLRFVGARRFITLVGLKCKGNVGRLDHKFSRGKRLADGDAPVSASPGGSS